MAGGLTAPALSSPLLPLAEAQARLLDSAAPLPAETVALAQAAGRWLAADSIAARTQPEADLSAMDGYAIRFADLPGPWRVIGESAAGHGFAGAVGRGEAVRIFTGAPLPRGTDTVVIQEAARRDGAALVLDGEAPPQPGHHVRARGLDFSQGDLLARAGDRLTPARIALLGAAGHGVLPVRRKVRVAVAATGDELVPPGAPVRPGQLPETNRAMLAAQLADLPIEWIDLGILPDQAGALEAAFRAVEADLLVTSGGASVGDHDLVRASLIAAGAEIDFWRIALRPGKPLMAGRRGAMTVLGLPGNAVSAFVTTLLFVRPLVARLAGAADALPRLRTVPLGRPLGPNGARTDFLRACLDQGRACDLGLQDSSMLRTLAAADCLIVRAPHAPAAHAGDPVAILDLA